MQSPNNFKPRRERACSEQLSCCNATRSPSGARHRVWLDSRVFSTAPHGAALPPPRIPAAFAFVILPLPLGLGVCGRPHSPRVRQRTAGLRLCSRGHEGDFSTGTHSGRAQAPGGPSRAQNAFSSVFPKPVQAPLTNLLGHEGPLL